MAQPQVRVHWNVEVNEPEPDIIDVVVPSSQKKKKDVLTVNNKNWKSLKELRYRERNRKRNEVYRTEMSAGILLLKKHVPGASHLNRPEVFMAAVNYITFLEKKEPEDARRKV
jgi:hypothetical protein